MRLELMLCCMKMIAATSPTVLPIFPLRIQLKPAAALVISMVHMAATILQKFICEPPRTSRGC